MVDIWPRDKASRCYADMTRTFVAGGGEPPAELAEFWKLTRDSLDRVYADLRAGADGKDAVRALVRALHRGRPADAADQDAGRGARGRLLPRARARRSGSRSTSARTWAGSSDELLAGDVVTVEPGCYRRGFGGCRLEDLVVVTADGYEILTDFPVRPLTASLCSLPGP